MKDFTTVMLNETVLSKLNIDLELRKVIAENNVKDPLAIRKMIIKQLQPFQTFIEFLIDKIGIKGVRSAKDQIFGVDSKYKIIKGLETLLIPNSQKYKYIFSIRDYFEEHDRLNLWPDDICFEGKEDDTHRNLKVPYYDYVEEKFSYEIRNLTPSEVIEIYENLIDEILIIYSKYYTATYNNPDNYTLESKEFITKYLLNVGVSIDEVATQFGITTRGARNYVDNPKTAIRRKDFLGRTIQIGPRVVGDGFYFVNKTSQQDEDFLEDSRITDKKAGQAFNIEELLTDEIKGKVIKIGKSLKDKKLAFEILDEE